uniref:ANAPC4_WD40 domain-containing protein n=2 Tax=Macrostomum lignano TaxID=282301 RepID=A0A1I8FVR4_9PLAT
GHKSSSNANGLIVSAHPSEPDLATCGGADDDMSVCRWSASQCRLVWRVAVEDACSSAAYHPRGHLLLLGTATGRIVALQHARGEYAISCQVTERGQAVVCVRFSSNASIKYPPNPTPCCQDGRLLALGTSDGRIYMMSVEDNGLVYRKYRQGTLTGHSSPVVRLDFSVDSATLRTWQLHQASSDTGITASCLSGHGDLLCAGDSAGQVSIFRYPTHPLQSQCVTSDALVSSVRDLMFAFGDSRLLVTDREAASLMQWSLVPERRS